VRTEESSFHFHDAARNQGEGDKQDTLNDSFLERGDGDSEHFFDGGENKRSSLSTSESSIPAIERNSPKACNFKEKHESRQQGRINEKNSNYLHKEKGPNQDDTLDKNDDGSQSIYLGGLRKFEASLFLGQRLASFREFFLKDGQLVPLRKGISFRDEGIMHLCRNINEVSEALEARNQMYQLHLAGEKFLKITQYKGKWAVDIREYHALNSIPSKRGIRLTPEDWSRFVQATNNGDIERVMNAADRHHTFTLKEDSVQNKANGKMQPEAYLHAVVSTAKKEAKKEELRRKLADIKKKTLILKERLSKKLKSR